MEETEDAREIRQQVLDELQSFARGRASDGAPAPLSSLADRIRDDNQNCLVAVAFTPLELEALERFMGGTFSGHDLARTAARLHSQLFESDPYAVRIDLVDTAHAELTASGSFNTVGALLKVSGELVRVSIGTEDTSGTNAVQLVRRSLRTSIARGDVRAAGYCFDAFVVPPGEAAQCDAISIHVETDRGEVLHTIVPYRLTAGRVDLRTAYAAPADPELFSDARSAS